MSAPLLHIILAPSALATGWSPLGVTPTRDYPVMCCPAAYAPNLLRAHLKSGNTSQVDTTRSARLRGFVDNSYDCGTIHDVQGNGIFSLLLCHSVACHI